jgi:hypothetical protein
MSQHQLMLLTIKDKSTENIRKEKTENINGVHQLNNQRVGSIIEVAVESV